MRTWLSPLTTMLAFMAPVAAQDPDEVELVTVRVGVEQAWMGQRVPLFVELRARGSFAGSASFDLPQLDRTAILEVGNPVVGSTEIADESWFTKTYEFALFSQVPGVLEVPAFGVRFQSRSGFTGPANDVAAELPAFRVEIMRPPGREAVGYVITTDSLAVEEAWQPLPEGCEVGALFRRTIVQRAEQVSGMALAPTPRTAPEGVRVYGGDAATSDNLTRGAFVGERRETLSYLVTAPGAVTLPALTYLWWDPTTESLQSTTLPAVSFEVAPAPGTGVGATVARRGPWLLLALFTTALVVGILRRHRLAAHARLIWRALYPPDRVAANQLRAACRRNDAQAAAAAWLRWRSTQKAGFEPTPALRSAVLDLQRRSFGPPGAGAEIAWNGVQLARAFDEGAGSRGRHSFAETRSSLPALNPRA